MSRLKIGTFISQINIDGEGDVMVKQEHRTGRDRRAGVDRRKFNDPNYKGTERRCGKDRRSGKERRKYT